MVHVRKKSLMASFTSPQTSLVVCWRYERALCPVHTADDDALKMLSFVGELHLEDKEQRWLGDVT